MVGGENGEDRGRHLGDSIGHPRTIGAGLYGELEIGGSTRAGLNSLIISDFGNVFLVGSFIVRS